MNEPDDPLLMEHEADGIRELDNKLPRWWVWLFWGTCIFSLCYCLYYHVFGFGNLMAAEYKVEMRKGEAIKAGAISRFESSLSSLQPSTDPATLESGKQTFLRLCAPCHRADGGGLVGPNLTDDYWLHGSNFVDNITTIWNGIPQKGMVTWKGTLKPSEIFAVGSYIYTLRGTKPPNPKLPENLAPVQTGPSPYE
jgi:cytochrome c oxidase cbb3-type subunit 3